MTTTPSLHSFHPLTYYISYGILFNKALFQQTKRAFIFFCFIWLAFATSCKHQQNAHESTTNQGTLASFSDGRYIFFLGKASKDNLPTDSNTIDTQSDYAFIICSTIPDYNKNIPKYIFDSAAQQPDHISIVEESCISAFRRSDNSALFVQPGAEKNLSKQDIHKSLSSQSFSHSKKQPLTHHLTAFGAGASLNLLFHSELRNMMLSYFNIFADLKSARHFNLPQMYFVLGSIPVQDSLFKMLGKEFDFLTKINESSTSTEEEQQYAATEALTSLGTMAGGLATSRMLMLVGRKSAGKKGMIAGYVVLPFLSLLITSTQTNPPEAVQKHLSQLFRIFSKQQAHDRVNIIKEDLTEFVYALGYALKIAGWGEKEDLASYCIPKSPLSSSSTPTCKELSAPSIHM
ncbi:MAG: hypothetical protein OXC44_07305 [Proteobacteria bacterium]|nr:hypothetical protein [Pseudomonadota bacterium]